jgi:hypothetical protein
MSKLRNIVAGLIALPVAAYKIVHSPRRASPPRPSLKKERTTKNISTTKQRAPKRRTPFKIILSLFLLLLPMLSVIRLLSFPLEERDIWLKVITGVLLIIGCPVGLWAFEAEKRSAWLKLTYRTFFVLTTAVGVWALINGYLVGQRQEDRAAAERARRANLEKSVTPRIFPAVRSNEALSKYAGTKVFFEFFDDESREFAGSIATTLEAYKWVVVGGRVWRPQPNEFPPLRPLGVEIICRWNTTPMPDKPGSVSLGSLPLFPAGHELEDQLNAFDGAANVREIYDVNWPKDIPPDVFWIKVGPGLNRMYLWGVEQLKVWEVELQQEQDPEKRAALQKRIDELKKRLETAP